MSHNYKIIDKPNLNMVKGFHTNGVEAHIKVTGRRDVGMILCDKVCDTFATYTTNQVKSAHITVCKEHLQVGRVGNINLSVAVGVSQGKLFIRKTNESHKVFLDCRYIVNCDYTVKVSVREFTL